MKKCEILKKIQKMDPERYERILSGEDKLINSHLDVCDECRSWLKNEKKLDAYLCNLSSGRKNENLNFDKKAREVIKAIKLSREEEKNFFEKFILLARKSIFFVHEFNGNNSYKIFAASSLALFLLITCIFGTYKYYNQYQNYNYSALTDEKSKNNLIIKDEKNLKADRMPAAETILKVSSGKVNLHEKQGKHILKTGDLFNIAADGDYKIESVSNISVCEIVSNELDINVKGMFSFSYNAYKHILKTGDYYFNYKVKKKSGEESYAILTPHAHFHIRGTEFNLKVADGSTNLELLSGEVVVSSIDAGKTPAFSSVTLKTGQTFYIDEKIMSVKAGDNIIKKIDFKTTEGLSGHGDNTLKNLKPGDIKNICDKTEAVAITEVTDNTDENIIENRKENGEKNIDINMQESPFD